MSVKKIFVTLITIVACVLIGAFVLNILLPNVTTSLVDATEQMVYNATGMKFDWNGNDSSITAGNRDFQEIANEDDTKTSIDNAGAVDGFT